MATRDHSESSRPRVQRIDSPDGKSSLFQITARPGIDPARDMVEGAVEMHLAMEREVLRHKGVAVTPDVESRLQQRAADYGQRLERERRDQGVAPHLVRLLGAPSKRDAERLAASMVITAEEFAGLVVNARPQLGYRHRMRFKEFHPEHHAAYSDAISDALRDAKPGPASPKLGKAMRKMEAMLDERKRVHAHMFERGAKWHCFFFDFNDLTDPERGPHVHYISHRWAEVSREAVWNSFDERHQSIPRGIHIRYRDERMERAAARRRYSKGKKKATGGYVLRVDPAPESDPERK